MPFLTACIAAVISDKSGLAMQFYPLFPPIGSIEDYTVCVESSLLTTIRKIPTAMASYEWAIEYLKEFDNQPNSFLAVRKDLNLFFNWAWLVAGKDIIELNRVDMNDFIKFGNTPPLELIGKNSPSMFLVDKKTGQVSINPNWLPFTNKKLPQPYQRKQSSLTAQLSNLSGFFIFLADVDYFEKNPAAVAIRNLTSNRFSNLAVDDDDMKDKALNGLQLKYALRAVEQMAKEDPVRHERTRFLIYFLLLAYPRVSEISARFGYSPTMSDFKMRRGEGLKKHYTFFIPSSKRGKSRNVMITQRLLDALSRYRNYLGMSDFPSKDDNTPLFVRHRAGTHGRQAHELNANLGKGQIGELVKAVFARAASLLREDNYFEDADDITGRSCHCWRHTGISMDLHSGRPKMVVMKCSGHSTEAVLAIYTHSDIEQRAESLSLKDSYIFDSL